MSDSNLAPAGGAASVDSTARGGDFTATLEIKVSPQSVFDALITPADLTNWWTPASGSGTSAGELVFRFGDLRANCHVDDAEPASRVRWTVLLCEPVPDWVRTNIAFDLTPVEGGGTRLDFRHHGLTSQLECFEMCSSGWTRHLGSLLTYLEAGHGNPSNPGTNERDLD